MILSSNVMLPLMNFLSGSATVYISRPDNKLVDMLHEHGVLLLIGKISWPEPVSKLVNVLQ